MPEPTVLPDLDADSRSWSRPGTLDVTDEQRQALAECVAAVCAHPHLSKRPPRFLMELWTTVALDETLEG